MNAESPDPIAVELLRDVRSIARDDPNPARRAWAWYALNAIDDEGLEGLRPAGLCDLSADVRRQALLSLLNLVDAASPLGNEARLAAAAGLDDESPNVRCTAGFLVGHAKWTGPWPGIARGLLDPSDYVRSAVKKRLDAGSRDFAEELAACLGALRSDDALVAADGLSHLGSLRVRDRAAVDSAILNDDALERALVSESIDVRATARRFYAVVQTPGETHAGTRRLLADPDPRVRRAAFPNEPSSYFDPADWDVLALGLADSDPEVFTAAALCAALSTPDLVDRDDIAERLDDVNLRVSDAAAAAYWLLETQGRSPEERVDFASRLLARFRSAASGSANRRIALSALVEFLSHTFERERRRYERVFYEATSEPLRKIEVNGPWVAAALALAQAIIEELPLAFADPDPRVRRSAVRAAEQARLWERIAAGRSPEQVAEFWRPCLALANDDDAEVRRALAPTLVWLSMAAETNAALASLVESAARRMIRDSDGFLAESGALACRQRWLPEAGPLLRGIVERDPGDDPWTIERWLDASQTLSRQPPHEWPIAALVDRAVGRDGGGFFAIHSEAIRALVVMQQVDRVFAAIDEMPPVEQGERMDALLEIVGDAEEQETAHRQVVEFLESRELPPCGYVTAAVEGVYMYGGMRGARTLFAWARESVGRPGARYAAIPHAIELRSDFSREEAEEAGFDLDDAFAPLRGDDPIAALLAVSSLADLHHRGFSAEGWHSKSNRERALVAEAIRRGASRRKD